MTNVESFYLDANLESDSVPLPQTDNDISESLFTADRPLDGEAIHRIIESQQNFVKNSQVVSDYCAMASTTVADENPNLATITDSVFDNHKYFAIPRNDSSHYAFHQEKEAVSSHHEYAQSPNIYTNDYMTSEPSDYVYM